MRRTHSAGFTLIELMVTIAVLAVILAVAIPSFQSTINNNRLNSAANEAMALMQTARIESLRRNKIVKVCPSAAPDAATPVCATASATGLIALLAGPGGGAVVRRMSIPANVTMQYSPAFGTQVVFRPDGFAHTAGGAMLNAAVAFCIAMTSPSENRRIVSITSGSRITTQRATGNPCSSPANTPP